MRDNIYKKRLRPKAKPLCIIILWLLKYELQTIGRVWFFGNKAKDERKNNKRNKPEKYQTDSRNIQNAYNSKNGHQNTDAH